MAFLNDLGSKLNSAAGATAAKAKELTEITKLNSQISSEEKQIEKWYTEIGKLVYSENKENPTGSCQDLCTKITLAMNTINELRIKIEDAKNHN